MKVIFACVHNAGRSQMAAGFYNQLAGSGAISARRLALLGTGIAKLSPGATRSRKALPGKCFRIWKFLRCFANTVELSQTGNFLIA